ncbi:hypothetical protein EIN_012790 [Entamoeba invadens IP1]|uniref:Uncharacterized protein n=1 Tax=Entamoeba invadens IP1 TaxID=370355 RepID=L7FM83_ENTIV|nr:hypothetical protein EIN_012790 [Entamoeba invadens IP1]ELP85742.1 hypothetical protein EIN_012790 [Entamoeba invadens IP1]|eukprot:XP_004185088.1 hypothetical protein EIN_012790 [Entamoeba invadens IP1]
MYFRYIVRDDDEIVYKSKAFITEDIYMIKKSIKWAVLIQDNCVSHIKDVAKNGRSKIKLLNYCCAHTAATCLSHWNSSYLLFKGFKMEFLELKDQDGAFNAVKLKNCLIPIGKKEGTYDVIIFKCREYDLRIRSFLLNKFAYSLLNFLEENEETYPLVKMKAFQINQKIVLLITFKNVIQNDILLFLSIIDNNI